MLSNSTVRAQRRPFNPPGVEMIIGTRVDRSQSENFDQRDFSPK
jgi:hypothetical protein